MNDWSLFAKIRQFIMSAQRLQNMLLLLSFVIQASWQIHAGFLHKNLRSSLSEITKCIINLLITALTT